MKKINVGIFELAGEHAELVLRDGTGGDVELCPGKGKPTLITIGGDYDNWSDLCDCLIHETLELVMIRENLRFISCPDFSHESDGFLFVFNHDQFSRVCSRAGMFVAQSLPYLADAWKKWKNPPKPKKRRRKK